ncbi:hypothetical protein SAMN05444365_104481 [Micromonospora pattaloongensis]|uniref:Uncharacterized protein n=1 Tax=Micromonospora pattaloongensis TaxID=405436 RepID=A0A1H3PFB6_9ACTN|nr:hypothetical protein [Micromonospora pattaloongensis]SDY99495.1 hypothetical protein SAMN05444365_104481 [Micromonospora pattaloongensis]
MTAKKVEVRGKIEVVVDGRVTDDFTADVDDGGTILTLRTNGDRVVGAYALAEPYHGPQTYQQPETD